MKKSPEWQQGILRLLIYLSNINEVNFQRIVFETDNYGRILRQSVEKLKRLWPIKTRIDNSSNTPDNMISLTDKGKKYLNT
ncbi:MAG: hypothetical protein QXX75_05045 [Thermoplasmatales archaeon]